MLKANVEFSIKYTCEIPVQDIDMESVMESVVAHLPVSFWSVPGFSDGEITISDYECWEQIEGYGGENF